MLVLSRKKNQIIRIGDEIILKVIETKGGVVKLGIEAPNHVAILRGELIPGAEEDAPLSARPMRRALAAR